MLNDDEMAETADRMLTRFGLPRFAMVGLKVSFCLIGSIQNTISQAVDGVHCKFEEKPRRLPPNKHAQQYWSRKQCYTINVQVVGNDKRFFDLDVGWPGSTHDSRIWNRSEVKNYIEQQRRYLIAGDTGYPISEVLIKPYTTAEAANSQRKRVFNSRLSGLRTVMSENMFGIWKRRFPVLKNLRADFNLSQKIIVATAILFNYGQVIDDEPPEEDDDDDDDRDDSSSAYQVIDEDRGTVRIRGQVQRDRLCNDMRM